MWWICNLCSRDVANYETMNYEHLLKMEQKHPPRSRFDLISLRALKFVNNSASSAQRAIVAAVDVATTGMYMVTGWERKKRGRKNVNKAGEKRQSEIR